MSQLPSRRQLTILDLMILIAGVAVGLWLFQRDLKVETLFTEPDQDRWLALVVSTLGGVSLAGTPLILIDRVRDGRRCRAGSLHWLAMGVGCWTFVPALAMLRLEAASNPSAAKACFVYTMPLMGLFLLVATFIGARPIARWWTCRGSWTEWLGMWILLGWALTGCYVLFLVYSDLL